MGKDTFFRPFYCTKYVSFVLRKAGQGAGWLGLGVPPASSPRHPANHSSRKESTGLRVAVLMVWEPTVIPATSKAATPASTKLQMLSVSW